MAALNAKSSTLTEADALLVPNTLNKTSSKASAKFEKRPQPEISFKDFLDFLYTAYQINQAIESVPNDLTDKFEIDWQNIAMNEFVSSLLLVKEDSSDIKTEAINKMADKEGLSSLQTKLSKHVCDKCQLSNRHCSRLEENILERKNEKQCDYNSEMSYYNKGQVSKSTVGNKDSESKEDTQMDSINAMDHRTSPVPREEILPVQKKALSLVTTGQPKNKVLTSGKYTENKRNMISNKKAVLFDCKIKMTNEENRSFEHLMKRKLNEVIQEGLVDSILSYIVPKQASVRPAAKKASNTDTNKALLLTSHDKSASVPYSKEKMVMNNRRKSTTGDNEVEIHVCDEVKNMKRDFRCPQKLLVTKMGYFAEVTTGQKLEDMDISVHCDITIFDWLMRWVKKDSLPENSWPRLDAGNVVPILVSAAFLQMDPLLQDCLEFCHQHMNDITKTSTNLACLNDSILTRLANLFSNSDVESLHDKKDKIQSHLYCKLILALTETSPEPARGHYASLASVYKCGKCDKLILHQLGSRISCKPCNMKMDHFGNVHGNHVRDPNWNLNDYIRCLRQDLKSWRHMYWRLWGDCHFLYCGACHNFFPVYQMQWCCHHPEPPQFFTMEHQPAVTYPTGRFSCCGERAFRFEILRNQSGCQFKEHSPVLDSPRDSEVHSLFMKHQNLITLEPSKFQFPEMLTQLVSVREPGKDELVSREVLWWDGIEFAPPRPRQGLLTKKWETHQKKGQQPISGDSSRNDSSASSGTNSVSNRPVATCGHPNSRKQMSFMEVASSAGSTPDVDHSSTSDDSSTSSSSSDDSDDRSEESGHAPICSVTTKPRRTEVHQFSKPSKNRGDDSCLWDQKLSVRSNQDNQREYEERTVRRMAAVLTRRTCADSPSLYARMHSHSPGYHGLHALSVWNSHIIPQGGIYVRLEHEWREANCHSHGYHGNTNRPQSMGGGVPSRPRVRPQK